MYQRVLNYQGGIPMRYEELSSEEQEIIRRYRQVPESQKKAILASENSFWQWLKGAVKWVWETTRMVKEVYDILKDLFGWQRDRSSDR